ncbi:hypothetical protein Taro_004038 [Colocasia esculenta]|uniref:Uncharacterized protein n=1 Tax=Colocasia esculenta TaxID=4460 RepID=A0A843TL27_COLES|nr:hypothetical protein [Colocasia esculenta]
MGPGAGSPGVKHTAMEARSWIEADESAKEMLTRTLAQRPFLLHPPLHRVPLRVGNAAVDCILPKEWNGIHFGGLERLVMYFDLDCRFDVLRLSEVLRYRLKEGRGFIQVGMQVGSRERDGTMSLAAQDDDELFLACMRRFLYIRCFSSYEFLAALKAR